MDTLVLVVVGVVVAILLMTVALFRAAWRVAEPDEALIISGFRAGTGPSGVGESMGFRIVTGRGTLIAPGLTKVRRMSLEAHESQITVPCVSQQKINLELTGVVMYKVGDDYRSIANAARRFLDRPAQDLETKVQNVFVGHLRSIAGSMTVEDMISDQDKFSEQVRDRCSQEMESFGLVIDSFQIQSIGSESNYIANLAVPHQAEIEQRARIARANAEREAIEQEQAARARIALATRDTDIKKAGYQAEIDKAMQESAQQGPLAQATSRQAVVEVATRVAQLEGQQREQQLQAEIRKPADAEAYKQTTLATAARDAHISQAEAQAKETRLRAEAAAAQTKLQAEAEAEAIRVRAAAQAEATRLTGQAEADAIKAKGLAQADAVRAQMAAEAAGIQLRAEAMSKNQEAVIAQQVAENLPQIVAAAAAPFEHVGNFTVLNGAQGVTSALAEIIQQAGALTTLARESLLPAMQPGTEVSLNGEAKDS
ncbi:flotillin family protein [Nocardia sp. NPDC052566]|uniref:flotillin family protein n=1 Tax=Nocardia sp. NPDC052566 TaxID=3364330 RepID=UPI0037C6F0F9